MENVVNTNNKSRINYSLNVLKFIAVFAVITMHSGVYLYWGDFGKIVVLISRFAVPVFFLISGFYSFYVYENYALKKYKTRSIRLIKLIIISNLLYIIFYYITKPGYNAISFFTFENIINCILFNIPPSRGFHLWFLQALLYCYLIFWIITKLKLKLSKGYFMIPILFSIALILSELFVFMGIEINLIYYRNFLLTGFPFFYLGFFIHDKQWKIKELSNLFLILCIIGSIFLILIELTLITGKMELTLGVLFLAISTFIICVNNPNYNNILSWIGGYLYTSMYILHVMIILLLRPLLNLSYFNLIIYFIATALLSFIIYIIKQYFNQNIHENNSQITPMDKITNETLIPPNQYTTNEHNSITPQKETPEEMEARIREKIIKEIEVEQRKNKKL